MDITDDFKSITIRWPLKYGIPVVVGRWQRLPDGRIEATYTREELSAIYSNYLFDLAPTFEQQFIPASAMQTWTLKNATK